MRLGVWLAVLGLVAPVGACSGGYPLPPTRCDEWCDATYGMQCETYYQPANCVSQCEQANLDVKGCEATFDALVTCFRASPYARQQLCVYSGQPNACQPQSDALTFCVSAQYLGGFGR